MNYNFVYGAGGDTHTGGDLFEQFDLVSTDADGLEHTGSTSGTLPGEPPSPYTAGVNCDLDQSFTITGPLNNFTNITTTNFTHVDSAASGVGVALMNSTNPGNLIQFEFSTQRARRYALLGTVTGSVNYPGEVTLRRWDGVTWQIVHTSIFLANGLGILNGGGTIPPGQYRLISATGINSQNMWRSANANASLDMLPNDVFISGRVTMSDFIPSMSSETVTIEIKNNFGVQETYSNVPLDASGNYSISTALTGWHWFRIRGLTWVARNTGWVNLASGANSVPLEILANGDADNSNEVDAIDIDLVIQHFGENTGGGSYFRPADLDGSGEVDAIDIDVAIANFGAVEN